MSEDADHVLQIKDALKSQREEKHMTNQEISGLSGLSMNTVNNYFSSRSKAPSIYTVGPLCAALGVSLDRYFGIIEDNSKLKSENQQIIEKQSIYITQLNEKLRIYKKILNISIAVIFVLLIACGFILFCKPIQLAQNFCSINISHFDLIRNDEITQKYHPNFYKERCMETCNMEAMKRAALYVRVSTEEQSRHGLSLDEQKTALESFAKANGYSIAGEYIDAGISARKPYTKRPALLRLLDDCKDGKIDTILFIKLDRWFRNVGGYYAVQEILDKYHVTWKATKEDYETETASGRLKVNIMLSVAQDEADRTSERIKFVFDGKRERREPITGHPPAGYKIVDKKIVKDENTEQMIDGFFQKFLQTGSISETQKYIYDKFGKIIDYQVASKILRSTAYYGFWHGVEGMCEPYITKEQYDQIQSMRQKVVRKTKENRVYLFSGLIFCGDCGNRMVGRTNKNSGTVNYNCPKYHEKRGCNNGIFISEKKVEAYIIETMDSKLQEAKIEIEKINNSVDNSTVKNQISTIKRKLLKLKDLYLNDLITLEEYKHDQASMTEEVEKLEKSISVPKTDNIEKIESLLAEDWKESYDHLNREEKRNAWRILIGKITINPDRSISYTLNV